MSGRTIEDLNRKNILASTVGIGCKPSADKYIALAKGKSVDYTAIKEGITNARKENKCALNKVNDLKKTNTELKDKRLANQHYEIWSNTAKQLLNGFNKIELDLEHFYFTILEKDLEIFKPFVQKIKCFEGELDEEFDMFLAGIIEPVKSISCDIKMTVLEHVKGQSPFEKEHAAAIKEEISRVSIESNEILNKLIGEFDKDFEFVEEICRNFNIISDYSNFISLEDIQSIPDEIQELEWPDEFPIQDIVQEYHELIENYITKFRHLETKYASHKLSNFSLTNFELEKAKFIMNQYTDTSNLNRRKLLLDRLEKEFPNMSKFEVRDLTVWHFGLEAYEFQKRLLIKSFFNSKTEYISKTKIHNQESWTSHFEVQEEKLSKEQRKKERIEFLVKLRDWKMKRLDILRMENDLAVKEAEEMEAKRKFEETIKLKETKEKKEKVIQFQKERTIREDQNKADLQMQIERTKKELANQIENDKEKINKRNQNFQEKIENRKMQKYEKNEFSLRKQELQQLITKKISDQVVKDPERIHHTTKAYNAKIDTSNPNEKHLQAPLFKVDTFTSEIVSADPRIRLELALRKAGLHKTKYAKEAMQRVSPMKQQKPELKSNIFQIDEK
ncbi:coiled-coil domain-containing protein [Oopsacas minuta]|uniref:Coiled-coil domain-containing protein n=1 Tax=Oopsacas minuta TaxID=111878 RepID=A0AAV7JFR5_9METZ|nr:coiled-coil domain-containing protein [Oopsacas minuta]